MILVRKIIKENWKDYLGNNNPTKHPREEIQKMINCSKSSCSSRIYSSCGKRYADDWSENIRNILHPAPCRHVVLTVPSFLRPNLRIWDNISLLFKSSRDFFKALT